MTGDERSEEDRVWEAYLSNGDTGRTTDDALFEDSDTAMEYIVECANDFGYSGVEVDEFEQVAEHVHKVDLNGPLNAIVCHAKVHSEVPG